MFPITTAFDLASFDTVPSNVAVTLYVYIDSCSGWATASSHCVAVMPSATTVSLTPLL